MILLWFFLAFMGLFTGQIAFEAVCQAVNRAFDECECFNRTSNIFPPFKL